MSEYRYSSVTELAFMCNDASTKHKDLENIVDDVEGMIEHASLFGGKVFGGYVRDIVIPALKNDGRYQEGTYFKDVDLWFKSQKEADDFLRDGRAKLRINPEEGFNEGRRGLYTFDCTQYLFDVEDIDGKICPVFVDIVVSDVVPVDDFSCNLLLYASGIGEHAPSFEFKVADSSYDRIFWSGTENESVNVLVHDLKRGNTDMLPTFGSKSEGNQLSMFDRMRLEKFQDKYKIFYSQVVVDKFPKLGKYASNI